MGEVFISHASADDGFVAQLRERLEGLEIPVWVDSRNLRGGSKLAPEIEAAISQASHVVVVLSPGTVNSSWVRREVRTALEVQSRVGDGYRVIPLLLPGVTPGALENWFPEEPVAVPVQVGPGGLGVALPALLAALGRRLPTDVQPLMEADARPVEELVLTLVDPRMDTGEGRRRVQATASLGYEPAGSGARSVVSRRFGFSAPWGPIETADIKWYLEDYHLWPVGVFRERARGVEARLPEWGRELYQAALGDEQAREVLAAWAQAGDGVGVGVGVERRFSVLVDADLPGGASEEAQAAAVEAAAQLLALPWELLHDGGGWLFQGGEAVRVRRRLPNRRRQPARPAALPVRILLVSPRPQGGAGGAPIGYIDHRASARPLIDAVDDLDDLVRLTVLQPPTYAALAQALRDGDGGEPFDVVHFDGHGVYDRRLGLGGLCFEDPADERLLVQRRMESVDATRLAGLVRRYRIPLVFLDACQTAMTAVDPTASVAGRLLEEGVASVVAMSHSVLVETARRFVYRFYAELARGARVGTAMLAGQQALFADTVRGRVLGAGQLRLQDWFVPVLYQEQHDPQLITRMLPRAAGRVAAAGRRLRLGELPEAPAHQFQGRSRDLLALERLLHRQPWAVLRGTGGQGKTTLAVELARWLVRTARFTRAAFVSLEHHRDARAVLDALGRQLVGAHYTVAEYPSLDEACQPLERALADHPSIVVLDNCESVLPDNAADGKADPAPLSDAGVDPDDVDDGAAVIFAWCRRLLQADARTQLVFTSRQALAAPFGNPARQWQLSALDHDDAVELVAQVMKQHGWAPPDTDPGDTGQEITDLVEAVNRHPRALVLLAREVNHRGVRATTGDLRALMAHLHRRHPGDRENSLYASVELSLRRLPPPSRGRVQALAACHGGVHLAILAELTGLAPDAARGLAIQLIEVGLGEDLGDGHLRLDPGLAGYLLGELGSEQADALRERWAQAMTHLTVFLYQQLFRDAQLASRLTLLELPNLLQMLDWLPTHHPPETVVDLASRVEQLVAELGRPQALTRATRARQQAAQKLGGFSHARYQSDAAQIDRLLEGGDLPAAHTAAQHLLTTAVAAGPAAYPQAAYPQAAYHIADAHWRLGRVLLMGGAAEAALTPLTEAQHRFQDLADANEDAERMVAVAITEAGDCLRDLGRLDSAADAYEEAIRRDQQRGAFRDVAVGKGQLATVRRRQKRYEQALDGYRQARDTFHTLGEPRAVATVWHQIGIVHEQAGQFEPSEHAYRQALAIRVRENHLSGQAATLGQLGNLYDRMGRFEEAVTFYRQAAEIHTRLGDLTGEGRARNNLARTLLRLNRHDEARQELQRAIVCKEPYGHAAQPWTTWALLAELERATGHHDDAHTARNHATDAYLAYRRAGGDSYSNQIQLFALVAQAIQDNTQDQAAHQLNNLLEPDDPSWYTALTGQLHAILAGNRDPTLAAHDELDYQDAAELLLLLETLHQATPDNTPE